jgi:hypothetical protein
MAVAGVEARLAFPRFSPLGICVVQDEVLTQPLRRAVELEFDVRRFALGPVAALNFRRESLVLQCGGACLAAQRRTQVRGNSEPIGHCSAGDNEQLSLFSRQCFRVCHLLIPLVFDPSK